MQQLVHVFNKSFTLSSCHLDFTVLTQENRLSESSLKVLFTYNTKFDMNTWYHTTLSAQKQGKYIEHLAFCEQTFVLLRALTQVQHI